MLDLSSFYFHEVKKSSENSLKVYIPITQLISRDTNLVFKNISDDEIPYIRMVPLINFATNKKTQYPMDETKRVIARLFLPGKYSSIELKDYSLYIWLLMKMDAADAFYDNPSMEAVMNWMCDAFEAAKEKSRRVVFQLQTDLLRDYAMLEGSYSNSKTSDYDYKVKDKLHVRYICFLDEPSLTKTWNEKSHELSSRWFDTYGVICKQVMELNINNDEVGFIWSESKSKSNRSRNTPGVPKKFYSNMLDAMDKSMFSSVERPEK
ncbi:20001_t:CDS:2 [Cetraspora pellucida]|uniref:20001_t:CDS:1 n=1 Tax=Cetraspora pellucida TaxID=1433469 RepID=A0A9N9BRT7_9GLOM|nr:20001_t:CDS:2 [Cetraspora pellucida]